MKNKYFLKDKKAQIYIKTEATEDDIGNWNSGAYYPISESSLWCYARQNSQGIVWYSAGRFYANDESRFFVFNNNPLIKQGAYILYKNNWYTIKRVDTTDDYNGDMFVYADDTPLGDLPEEEDIKPYDPTIF